jgi:hypothetical protein
MRLVSASVLIALAGAGVAGAVFAQSERVTISADRLLVRSGEPTALSGAIASGQGGQLVTIEAKTCGQTFFTARAGTVTSAGGEWVAPRVLVGPGHTAFRARWNSVRSTETTVQVRATVAIAILSRGLFRVHAYGFGRKRANFERYEPTIGVWRRVRSVVLDDDGVTDVRASVRRKTLVRIVLPRSQVGRCYLAGYSNLLRT